MTHDRRVIAFINAAHFIDHMFMLIFPAAVIAIGPAFGRSYGEMLALSLGGFVAFGAGSIPSGWLGDLWSRRNMMAVFFVGIGVATVLTAFATTPATIAVALTGIGLFGSIYHPVGTAMLTAHAEKVGREIGINGVWGNLGVASAALVTGGLIQFFGWRAAFMVPGLVSIAVGVLFLALVPDRPAAKRAVARAMVTLDRATLIRAFAVLAVVTVAGGIVFNASTVSMPKLFAERLGEIARTPFAVGAAVFAVFALGSVAQIIVGRLIDRHSLRRVFMPLSALQAPALLAASVAGDWTLLAVAVALMFAVFGQVTINDGMVARYTSEAWRARAYALRYLVSFGASAASVPLVAFMHDRAGGFGTLFLVLAVFGAVVFLGAVAFPGRSEVVPAPEPAAAE